MDFFATTVTLILVLDPFGNLPMISSILTDYSPKEQRRILIREKFIALAILALFLFIGEPLLDFLALDQSTLKISGGVILFLIALGMLFPSKSVLSGPNDETSEEPFIVPIAIPLVAGPSSLAFVMLLAKQYEGHLMTALGSVVAAWACSFVIILASPLLMKFFGKKGMRAMERLMGMILILISIQLLLDGLSNYLTAIFIPAT